MVDTVRTLAQLIAAAADNTTGNYTNQSQRDFIVSVASWTAPFIAPVYTVYTVSGAIALTDDVAIINASSSVAMTLQDGTVADTVMIKRYGAGAVTVTATIDGTASQSVLLNSIGGHEMLQLRWCVSLSTWIMG